MVKIEQEPEQIVGSRCWLCGLGRLTSQGVRETGAFSPASHSLDSDSNLFMSGLGRIEEFSCPTCNMRLKQENQGPLEIISIPFTELTHCPWVQTDERHRELEELLWLPASCPAALKELYVKPWKTWKRRFWLRAAAASGNLLVMQALIDLRTPLTDQLSWAIFKQQTAAAELLLERGADLYEDLSFETLVPKLGLNFMGYGYGQEEASLFRLALYAQQFSLACRLIGQGVTEFDESDVIRASLLPQGKTPQPGQREVLRLLLAQGFTGYAALYDALQYHEDRRVRLLCDAGVDLRSFCRHHELKPLLEHLKESALRVFCEYLVQALKQMK